MSGYNDARYGVGEGVEGLYLVEDRRVFALDVA
jgi:hypothetical protein